MRALHERNLHVWQMSMLSPIVNALAGGAGQDLHRGALHKSPGQKQGASSYQDILQPGAGPILVSILHFASDTESVKQMDCNAL